jgi:uncharacterized protein
VHAGDVAGGLVAVLLVHRRDRVVRRWTGSTLVYVVLGFVVMSLAVSGTLDLGLEATDAPLAASYLGGVVLGALIGLGQAAMAVVLAAYLPLVLVGVLLQRAGWLERPAAHLPALRRAFALGMVVNLASSMPVTLLALGVWRPGALGTFVASYLTLVGDLVAVCGFALLAHRWAARGRRALPGALASLGERSLTGYLGQSLVLAPPAGALGARVRRGVAAAAGLRAGGSDLAADAGGARPGPRSWPLRDAAAPAHLRAASLIRAASSASTTRSNPSRNATSRSTHAPLP